eukprot:4165130-Prymnesium_polylepis.1
MSRGLGDLVCLRVLLAAPARFPAAMASKYPIAEKNLLKIIFSNRNITLHAVNNKTGHIFCHASSLTPKLRQQLQEKSDEWTPSQRQATMSQKTRLVAKTFAERAQELGVPELTWERDHQPGGRQARQRARDARLPCFPRDCHSTGPCDAIDRASLDFPLSHRWPVRRATEGTS